MRLWSFCQLALTVVCMELAKENHGCRAQLCIGLQLGPNCPNKRIQHLSKQHRFDSVNISHEQTLAADWRQETSSTGVKSSAFVTSFSVALMWALNSKDAESMISASECRAHACQTISITNTNVSDLYLHAGGWIV